MCEHSKKSANESPMHTPWRYLYMTFAYLDRHTHAEGVLPCMSLLMIVPQNEYPRLLLAKELL